VAARTGVAAAFDEDGLEDGDDGLVLAGGDADALPDKLELGAGVGGLLIGWDVMMIVFCGPSTVDSIRGLDALVVGLEKTSVAVLKGLPGTD